MKSFGLARKAPAKAKNKAGLDIGSHALKIVEFSAGGDKPLLAGLGTKKIAKLPKTEISSAIKALAEEAKISAKEFNISVSGHSIIVRFISMPKMREEDLKGAIKFEAEKFIPFNINDCIVDYQTLRQDDRENKLTILLVAAKKDYVQEKIKLVEDAGFSVNVVDVDSFAVANAFLKNAVPAGQDKTAALLNIGASFTNLAILRNDIISFSRDVAIGSNDFNSAISKGLGVNAEAAEELKLSPKDKLQDLAASIRPVLNNLLDEVKLSFSYHENQGGKGIDEIYISGGGAGIAGLDAALQEAFGAKPNYWNPLQFLGTNSASADANLIATMKNSFAVASGLALR